MSLGKKDILAEERRRGKRMIELRRQYNQSVLSGGGDTMDISCKIDPEKKIKIKGYEKYDVYECKDKNKKILQDYKIKQLFKDNEENLLKSLMDSRQSHKAEMREKEAELSRLSHNNKLLLKNFKNMKEIEKRNDILKAKLLKESNNSYVLQGELIKMRQDNEEYRKHVLNFYQKMEKQDKIRRDVIMKGREMVLKQNFQKNIQKHMRNEIQKAQNAIMQYYVEKMNVQEKHHAQQTEKQLEREDKLLKQLEGVKAQLGSTTQVWSDYVTHTVKTMNTEIEKHKEKRKKLEDKINEIEQKQINSQ